MKSVLLSIVLVAVTAPMLILTTEIECPDGCLHQGKCYSASETWTDGTAGCVSMHCIKSEDGKYNLASLGCPLTQPPKDGKKYVQEEDTSKGYPDCCPKWVLDDSCGKDGHGGKGN